MSGVKLDPLDTESVGGRDGIVSGVDKEGDFDFLFVEAGDSMLEGGMVSDDGETPFGGDLFALFGDDGGTGGAEVADDVDDLRSYGAFEVDRKGGVSDDSSGIFVVHMAAVFAQVDGDLIGTGSGADTQRLQRIGIVDAAGFAQDGNVVDVDSKMHSVTFRGRIGTTF